MPVKGSRLKVQMQFILKHPTIRMMLNTKMATIYFVQHHQQQYQHRLSNHARIPVSSIFPYLLNCGNHFLLRLVLGSLRSPRQRRQRTTSMNLTKTLDATESIIRANNRTIYTAGRPPWYNCAGQQVEPFVIGWCFVHKE